MDVRDCTIQKNGKKDSCKNNWKKRNSYFKRNVKEDKMNVTCFEKTEKYISEYKKDYSYED